MEQERNRIIEILQRLGKLCKSEEEVCDVSKQGHGCNCGEVYKEIWNK